MDGVGVSVALVTLVSVLLVGTGLRKQPGFGVLGALVVVGLVGWWRGDGLGALGFAAPASWPATVGLALALGAALQALSALVVDPLVERLTGVRPDLSVLAGVRGSWRAFALWMALVWLVVAPIEEAIFRGFLMTEIARVVGTSPWAVTMMVSAPG